MHQLRECWRVLVQPQRTADGGTFALWQVSARADSVVCCLVLFGLRSLSASATNLAASLFCTGLNLSIARLAKPQNRSASSHTLFLHPCVSALFREFAAVPVHVHLARDALAGRCHVLLLLQRAALHQGVPGPARCVRPVVAHAAVHGCSASFPDCIGQRCPVQLRSVPLSRRLSAGCIIALLAPFM